MPSLEELFCSVDDFCQIFEPQWQNQLIGHNLQLRKRERRNYLRNYWKRSESNWLLSSNAI
jgi:hypothetical protein